ncbi:tetratricopeptide repeat protein [Flavobacterium haoranii]|uniref:tetratricopeptide repeat protein n=1 Tax=Flavobacterium haoranii TaxID=683124 RepID=UPI001D0EB562|nr:tetratricopeptide repeat protein [Flavobacterium haoranii]
MYKIAKIEENFKNYNEALKNYNTIIESFNDSVLIDEALFFSAEIYRTIFNENDKAKQLYEKIIFNHQDSIYFTEARRQYRILRGDTNI